MKLKTNLFRVFLVLFFVLQGVCAKPQLILAEETVNDEYTGPAEDTYNGEADGTDENTIKFENMFGTGFGTTIENNEEFTANMNKLLLIAKVSLNGLIGVGLVICVFAFSVQAFNLALKGKIPGERAKILSNLMTLTIATAGLGGFPLLFAFVMMLLAW